MKSRNIPAEYDDMTGLEVLPAGLFLFLREKILRNGSLLQTEMHPLWTIAIKRPEYNGNVLSMTILEKSMIHFAVMLLCLLNILSSDIIQTGKYRIQWGLRYFGREQNLF